MIMLKTARGVEEPTDAFLARRKKNRSTQMGVGAGSVALVQVFEVFMEHPTWASLANVFSTPPDLVFHGYPLLVGVWGLAVALQLRREATGEAGAS